MHPVVRWAHILVVVATGGWRLPVAAVLLFAASWLTTSDIVRAGAGAGYFLDSPANLLSTPNAVILVVLPGFLLLTGDLVARTLRSGLAGYAAARLESRARWWMGTMVGMLVLAVLYAGLSIAVSLGVGLLRLGATRPDGPARQAMLAHILLPAWLTEPSPAQLGALLLPLVGALAVIGMVPAVVSLWTSSTLVPALPVAGWLLTSLVAGAAFTTPPVSALLDVVGGVNAAAYRDYRSPDGTLFVGRSLPLAVAIAAAWLVVLGAIGWVRVRRSGIPLRG